jgi:hypothetical protein
MASGVSRLFAQAAADNRYSCRTVENSSGDRLFPQEEVPYAHLPRPIRRAIHTILRMSGDGWINTSIEVGFYAAQKGRRILTSEPVTSYDSDTILEKDLRWTFKKFVETLSDVPGDYKRFQFYHTHPRAPSARQISRADVDYALTEKIELERGGINVPYDMFALPHELSRRGVIQLYYEPPPLGSKAQGKWVTAQVKPTALRMTIE